MKYLAIKVRGLPHWIWFETKQTVEVSDTFKGSNGWGKNGAQTDVEVPSS